MNDTIILTRRFDRTGIDAFFDEQPQWDRSEDVRHGYDEGQGGYTCTLSGSAFSAYVSFVAVSAAWLSKQGSAWYAAHLIWCAKHGGFTAPVASVLTRSSGVTRYQGPMFC